MTDTATMVMTDRPAPSGNPRRGVTKRAPSHYVDKLRGLATLVETHATESGAQCRLAAPVVDGLHEAGLFRMLLPLADGGGGLSLADAATVFEAAARVDGSVGWNLCVANIGLAVVVSGLGDVVRQRVVDDPRAIVAGGVNPGTVTATPAPGGYVFNGTVAFASGSADATWLLTAAVVAGDETPTLLVGLFPPAAVDMQDTWRVSGLRATGSNDFTIRDVFVPHELTFPLALERSRSSVFGSGLPLASLLGFGLSFVAVGIATRAADKLVSLASAKTPLGASEPLSGRADVQAAVARARALVDSGRAYVREEWRRAHATRAVTPADLARLRLSYVTAAQNAVAASEIVWSVAGSSALYESDGLERCWRDVHAASQHMFVSPRHLDRIGRITLGLPPGPGPI